MSKLSNEELIKINKYFKAANYLSVGQLYLKDNPLLKRPLESKDLKYKILGHFGTVPGQNFIYAHLNRIIKKYDLNMIYVSGPGHGGNSLTSNTYLEGSFSHVYKDVTISEDGMKKLFKSFSYPSGLSSHASAQIPGSIHEGGELGYSLSHAYGAVLDNPDLIVACVIGDGEAETGPLMTSFNGNKFINRKTDGVVLPILHLNGYKISNPTVLSRIPKQDLIDLFSGFGYDIYYLEGTNPLIMHEKMATIMDDVVNRIKDIKKNNSNIYIKYPMIILKTPKGWTGPKIVDGLPLEDSFRSHQVPLNITSETKDRVKELELWLKSYNPELLFDEKGNICKDILDTIPDSNRRMGTNKVSNGGLLLKELILPDYKNYLLELERGKVIKQDMVELGKYLRDVLIKNPNNFKLFSPDEALSNRLNSTFEATNRKWNLTKYETDEFLASDGSIYDSYLSEHLCEGMLEGYILTGRHGLFDCYEAFIRIVDSMVSQHAKWIKMSKEVSFRKEISSLNLLLTSHVWQQDHNGYTHQDPGFINHIITKKEDIVRVYLPPDANTLICTVDKILKTKNMINTVIASKHLSYQWFTKEEAIKLCDEGVMIVPWASDDNPDIILCAIGDTPTLEVFMAQKLLKENSDIKIRVVNIVNLMKLKKDHPVGLTDNEYERIFTNDKPIIFVFHGYSNVIHDLVYNRNNLNISVHGYMEEGTITTPFDMRVLNKIDRYHIVIDALNKLNNKDIELSSYCNDMLKKHSSYIKEYGKDLDEVIDFKY